MSAPPDKLAAVPANLKANPRLGQWLSIRADGTVQVRSGKVDLGQGISVALAQIVADGLGVNIERVHMTPASTAFSPNEGVTSGSLSVQDSGSALRQVCVEARAIYLRAAASLWGLPHLEARAFQIVDGQITWSDLNAQQDWRAGSRATSYWALADDALLAVDATGSAAPQGAPFAADGGGLAVGQSIPRRDIAGKVSGAPSFVHDLRLPGMLYGRVVHPPSSGAELELTDIARIDAMAGVVATVRDGNFLGVVAKGEFQAVQASERLAALSTWRETARLPAHQRIGEFLRTAPSETSVVGEKTAGARRGLEPASQTFKASYSRPFLAHASIGPSCAVARFTPVGKDPLSGVMGDTLEVWCHAQGVYNLRADLALMLGLPARAITVQHVEGAGCYGHNGADDVAAEAALLARAMPGVPVQVVWSREEELACAPFGPAMAVDLQAALDADGRISNWQHEVWSNGHGLRPGRGKAPVLLAGTLLARPFERQVSVNAPLAAGGGAERNAVPLYDFGQWKATSHRLLTMPVRSSALRSLGAHCNVFAVESFMDEIAHSAGVDPLAFRLKHLADARAREVLQAVAGQAGWLARSGALPESHGLGLAVTRYKNTGAYCAVVAQVDVSRDLRVTDLWLAADVGLVINPDGVVNQLEGGAIQTVSWVLKEAVQFDTTRITSRTWGHYPILKFTEVPRVHVRLLDRPEEKSVGAGEATHGPVAAAIANALFNATAVRVRDLPLTPERIRQVALAQ